jgi:shikimate kinase
MGVNYIFIGFMGCGKTTFGKKISRKIGYKFVDTDKYIEKKEKMTVSDIFAKYGESYFRSLEENICSDFAHLSDMVIATGGGIIKNEKNIENLKKNGVIIYLKANAEHIFSNIGNDNTRPLLQVEDKLGKIQSLLEERTPIYEKCADITIDVSGGCITGITNDILKAIGRDCK